MSDNHPDFVVPLACAVAGGETDGGVVICDSGVGVRLIYETLSAHDQDIRDIALKKKDVKAIYDALVGIELEEKRNAATEGMISAAVSRVAVHVICRDEEQMIARSVRRALGLG